MDSSTKRRQRKGKEREFELIGEESVGAADANIAQVDGVFHLEGDPVVLCEPEQVGRGNRRRGECSQPEPAAAQRMTLRGKQEQRDDDAELRKSDGVFG